MPVKRGEKQLAENRKARHEYFIEDTYECGMALVGTEVKSIRLGKVNIKDSYVKIKNGEAFVVGMHISPYERAISSIVIPSASANCCCISVRF